MNDNLNERKVERPKIKEQMKIDVISHSGSCNSDHHASHGCGSATKFDSRDIKRRFHTLNLIASW